MKRTFTVTIKELANIHSLVEVEIDDEKDGVKIPDDQLEENIHIKAFDKISESDCIEQRISTRDTHIEIEEGSYVSPEQLAHNKSIFDLKPND